MPFLIGSHRLTLIILGHGDEKCAWVFEKKNYSSDQVLPFDPKSNESALTNKTETFPKAHVSIVNALEFHWKRAIGNL